MLFQQALEGFQHDLKGIWVDPEAFQPCPEDSLVLLKGLQLDLEGLWVCMEGFEQGLEMLERDQMTLRRRAARRCAREV